MVILGISCFYHDSAASLIVDGAITAAAQEERFTRIKHDPSFPQNAINYCLSEAGITIDQVGIVAFYDKPFLKFERILETYLTFVPKGLLSAWKSLPVWIKEKLWIKELVKNKLNYSGEIVFTEHHESHAASAFFPSPYESSAIITMDGVGEWATSSVGFGNQNQIELLYEQHFPHSLGLLYSAFTYYTGFKVNSGEYKLMGLAPYGTPEYVKMIYDHLVDIKDDGSFHLNQEYFNYSTGLTMTNRKFDRLFGGPPRKPESAITQREMNLAASVQVVTESIFLKTAQFARNETGSPNVCLAGGVALNCVANGKLLNSGIFDNIWIQPASGDAGGALGAAVYVWFNHLKKKRIANGKDDSIKGSYLGPGYSNEYILNFLTNKGYPFTEYSDKKLAEQTAADLANEKVVGWFQGRMEFGPRALGNRSILGDARSKNMQKILNLKIKFRESFRPFAPSVLASHASEYFDLKVPSPYMLLVAQVNKNKLVTNKSTVGGFDKLYQVRSHIPAITHVDNSARIQTVDINQNKKYFDLISEFNSLTNCPVIINTSFNVRGEPIVCSPEQAYQCFMRTNMDVLVLGNFYLLKTDQPRWKNHEDWKEEYPLD